MAAPHGTRPSATQALHWACRGRRFRRRPGPALGSGSNQTRPLAAILAGGQGPAEAAAVRGVCRLGFWPRWAPAYSCSGSAAAGTPSGRPRRHRAPPAPPRLSLSLSLSLSRTHTLSHSPPALSSLLLSHSLSPCCQSLESGPAVWHCGSTVTVSECQWHRYRQRLSTPRSRGHGAAPRLAGSGPATAPTPTFLRPPCAAPAARRQAVATSPGACRPPAGSGWFELPRLPRQAQCRACVALSLVPCGSCSAGPLAPEARRDRAQAAQLRPLPPGGLAPCPARIWRPAHLRHGAREGTRSGPARPPSVEAKGRRHKGTLTSSEQRAPPAGRRRRWPRRRVAAAGPPRGGGAAGPACQAPAGPAGCRARPARPGLPGPAGGRARTAGFAGRLPVQSVSGPGRLVFEPPAGPAGTAPTPTFLRPPCAAPAARRQAVATSPGACRPPAGSGWFELPRLPRQAQCRACVALSLVPCGSCSAGPLAPEARRDRAQAAQLRPLPPGGLAPCPARIWRPAHLRHGAREGTRSGPARPPSVEAKGRRHKGTLTSSEQRAPPAGRRRRWPRRRVAAAGPPRGGGAAGPACQAPAGPAGCRARPARPGLPGPAGGRARTAGFAGRLPVQSVSGPGRLVFEPPAGPAGCRARPVTGTGRLSIPTVTGCWAPAGPACCEPVAIPRRAGR